MEVIEEKAAALSGNFASGLDLLLEVETQVCKSLGAEKFEMFGRGPFHHFVHSNQMAWLVESFKKPLASASQVQSRSSKTSASDSAQRPLPDVQEALESAFKELFHDNIDILDLLQMLERRVCQNLQLSSFSEAGHCSTFLAFVAKFGSPVLRGIINGGGPRVPRSHVLSAASRLAANDVANTGAVLEARLCHAFGVATITELGFSTAEDITTFLEEDPDIPIERGSELTTVNISLACPWYECLLPERQGKLNFRSIDFAKECILLCPHLEDIEAYLHWRTLFANHHGELASVCMKIISAEECSVRFIQPYHGGPIMAVDRNPSNEKFSQALVAHIPAQAAEQLVALLASEGSMASLSKKTLQHYVKIVSKEAIQNSQTNDLIIFLLRIVSAIPAWDNLRSSFAPILFEPLLEVMSSGGARWSMDAELIRMCKSDPVLLDAVLQAGLEVGQGGVLKVDPLLEAFWQKLNQSKAASEIVTTADESHVFPDTTVQAALGSTKISANAIPVLEVNNEDKESTPKDQVTDHRTSENAKAIVQTLQAENIGEDLNSKQWEFIRNSLDKISADLYSKKAHFVHELIQNAEDNSYGEVEPELKFIVSCEDITVENNEVGFVEENVRALCHIGNSSKGSGGRGFIGQKGIGFKSVFIVSNRPEIHSNGFHFALDEKFMIVPEWIDGVPNRPGWTIIKLPLNQQNAMRLDALQQDFAAMTPSLLLFLHKLRKITIIDRLDLDDSGVGVTRTLKRVDRGNNIVELHDNSRVEEWFVVRRRFSNLPVKRSGTDATEIAIAIPVDSELDRSQDVFAFLPVDNYGFKFVVQADFILPGSRESILEDEWNEQIRDHIHKLFVDALHLVQLGEETCATGTPAGKLQISHLLQIMPMDREIRGLFKPVVSKLFNALRNEKCIPTAENIWCIPRDVVIAGDFIKSAVPPDMLFRLLGKRYLRDDVQDTVDVKILGILGVHPIDAMQVLALLESGVGDVAADAGWAGTLLAHLQRENALRSSDILARLKKISIYPLSDGQWVSLDKGPVFRTDPDVFAKGFQDQIPTIHEKFFSSDDKHSINRALDLLEVKFASAEQIIEKYIVTSLSAQTGEINREMIAAFLRFIQHHFEILSEKESVKYKLMECLWLPVCQVNRKSDARDWSWLPTGTRRLACMEHDRDATGVYLAASNKEEANSNYDWAFDNLAPAHRAQWCVVDSKFLRQSGVDPEFLRELGVDPAPYMFAATSWGKISMEERPWVDFDEPKRSNLIDMYGQDFFSADIKALLQHLTGDPLVNVEDGYNGKVFSYSQKMYHDRCDALQRFKKRLFKSLDKVIPKLWAVCSQSSRKPQQSWSTADRNSSHGPQWRSEDTRYTGPSTVCQLLRHHFWLPSTASIKSRPTASKPLYKLYTPCNTFLADSSDTKINEISGDGKLNVLEIDRANFTTTAEYEIRKEFWLAVGVRDKIDGATLVEVLRSWANAHDDGSFESSVDHFQKVLRHAQMCLHIADQKNPGMAALMRKAFSTEALIWIPDVSVERRAQAHKSHGKHEFYKHVQGKFWRVCDLAWTDPAKELDATPGPPRIVGEHYTMADVRHFFTATMCWECRRSGLGAKGKVNCENCFRDGERYKTVQKASLEAEHGKISNSHFTCAGTGTALVPYMATVNQYVGAMANLSRTVKAAEAEERVKSLLKVLSIGIFLGDMPMTDGSLRQLFEDQQKVFPGKRCQEWDWAKISDTLLINDDPSIAELFGNDPDICFLQFGFNDPTQPFTEVEKGEASDTSKVWSYRPGLTERLRLYRPELVERKLDDSSTKAYCVRETTSLRPLLLVLGIPSVSECIDLEVRPLNSRLQFHPAFELFVEASKVAQCWFYSRMPKISQQRCCQALEKVQIYIVDSIELEYRLAISASNFIRERRTTAMCHLTHAAEFDILYISSEILSESGFNSGSEQVWQCFTQIISHQASGSDFGDLVQLLQDWECTLPAKRADWLIRKNVRSLPGSVEPIWKISIPRKKDTDDMSPMAYSTATTPDDREDLETFSGGFDFVRRPKSKADTSSQQFPSPQYLEVVVKDEDEKHCLPDPTGKYKTNAEAVQSNVIFTREDSVVSSSQADDNKVIGMDGVSSSAKASADETVVLIGDNAHIDAEPAQPHPVATASADGEIIADANAGFIETSHGAGRHAAHVGSHCAAGPTQNGISGSIGEGSGGGGCQP